MSNSKEPANLQQIARAVAEDRIRHAMELIEQAQNDLALACAELSAVTGGVPIWRATSKLHDRVKAHWYRVDAFRGRGRFGLDSLNTEALRKERTGRGEV